MPVQKSPDADLRRRYPLYAEVGLALALGLTVLAFTVPTPAPEPMVIEQKSEGPILLEDVPPTAEPPPPPPPPPPVLPPPVTVPDDEVVEDVIEEVVLTLEAVPALPGSPAAPMVAPPLSSASPPPPPPGPTDDEGYVLLPEVQPELIGGLEALQRNVVYPEAARRAGIEGRVIIQFVVDERGNVVDPVVARSPNDALSEAALEAVRQAKFRPGQQRGRPVKVRFSLPVTFRLH